MVSSLDEVELHSQSNGRIHNVGISHTMCLAARECPSVRHYCSFHTCVPIQSHCGLHPMSGSNVHHACPPTMSLPVSLHGCLDRSVHPICHPTLSSHLPRIFLPICLCTLCYHLVHHISHPTCQEINQAHLLIRDKLEFKKQIC